MKFDLVVVGAGPAGSMAARTAVELGLKVALLEKRQEIGSPVRCGEGVSRWGLHKLLDPDPSWIAWEVAGSRVYSPDGSNITLCENQAQDEVGYVLERKVFDRGLAAEAADAGATLMVKTRATGLIFRDGIVSGVSALSSGEAMRIEADLVIGADGVESKVGRWAGLYGALKPENLVTCAQLLVHDRSIDSDHCQFYLGRVVAPGGYIWIIPKGSDLANVGACIMGSMSKPGLPERLLRDFLRRWAPDGKLLDLVIGGIPVSRTPKALVGDGVMLVGDAARQADPFSFAGVLNGMNAGVMAGKVAAEAISSGNVSKNGLKPYQDRWKRALGRQVDRDMLVRTLFMGLMDEDLNGIIRALQGQNTAGLDLGSLFKLLFKLKPRLLLRMAGQCF